MHYIDIMQTVVMVSAVTDCCVCFQQGGFYLFNLADYYIGGFPLLIVGLLECVALCYVYGM